MKKIITLMLILTFATQSLAAGKINNEEYNQLIIQCHNIRTRILQENNFEVIKQYAIQNHQQTIAAIAERFVAQTNGAASSPDFVNQLNCGQNQLKNSLAVLEAEHNLKINSLIIKTIIAFLTATNTKTASKLLADLIANGFVF